MYVDRLESSGFTGFASPGLELTRITRLDGPVRRRAAFADALLLPFAAIDPRALTTLVHGWGVQDAAIDAEGATWAQAPWLASLTGPEGQVTSTVRLVLDPPLYGVLRGHALRDPRLVDALAAGPTLTLVAGLRFSPAWDAVAVDLLSVRVGEVSFPTAGPDRPTWLDGVLRSLGRRLVRDAVPRARWLDAASSWAVAEQKVWGRARAALASSPAGLAEVLPLPGGPAVWDGDELVPVERVGGGRALELVGAVHLAGADVVLVQADQLSPAWVHWLAAQVEGDGSPLEQVLLLGVADGQQL